MNYSDKLTSKELAKLEKRIKEIYQQTYIATKAASDKYFEEYEERYMREWKKWKDGQYTDQQFKDWVRTQLSRGEGWDKLKDTMAQQYVNADIIAADYINGTTPSIFASNANFAAYEISKDYENVLFDLVDENVIKNLITESDNFTEFKTVSINPKRDYEWNSKQIQTALTAGIIQGDSIDDIAKSFMVVMQRNENAARRNARTACTSAQNAGRISTMKEAQAQGIKVRKRWLSASDGRVRDSHAHLNGQIRDVDKAFDNGLMFPADSNGRPEEVYNCRCTLTYIYPKYDSNIRSSEDYSETKKQEESYQEWLKRMKSEDNDLKSRFLVKPENEPSEIAKQIRKTKDAVKQMQLIGNMTSSYITSKSQWNGKIIIKSGIFKNPSYNRFSRSIKLTKNSTIKSKIHEYLHSCTDNSGRTFENEKINGRLNEGVIEYLAQEICKAEGIPYNPTYATYVKPLRDIARIINVSDMQLARVLMDTKFEERYSTLESLTRMASIGEDSDAKTVKRALRKLYGIN